MALIICESFKPVSLVLPANRSTDTHSLPRHAESDPGARRHLWQKTIDAKCQNQLSLAEHVAPTDAALPRICAKPLWARSRTRSRSAPRRFGRFSAGSLNDEEFTRDRARGGLNNLLNYGYAVLLSTVLQKLFGVGLDPTFGIAHVPRERSTPLAYDLMEPFRPCVEWRVIQWVQEHPNRKEWEVSKEFRKWVTGFPLERVEYLDLTLEIQGVH